MAIDFGLAPKPVDYLQGLQAFGLGQQAAAKRKADRRAEETRVGVTSHLSSGDLAGARQVALSGGDMDMARQIGEMDDAARKRVSEGMATIGSLAYQLRQVADPVQRQAQFQAALPALRAHGLDDNMLGQVDLSDAGLDAYVATAQDVTKTIEQHTKGAEQFTLNPGAIRYGPNGQVVARSPYDPVIVSDGVVYSRPASGGGSPSPSPSPSPQLSPQELQAAADEAISHGADPAAVHAELQRMLGGAGQPGPQTFP